jgi:hypothetical protein
MISATAPPSASSNMRVPSDATAECDVDPHRAEERDGDGEHENVGAGHKEDPGVAAGRELKGAPQGFDMEPGAKM